MDISRDQHSFLPISRQGSILTLCHGGWFGISVQKYIGWNWFQLPGGLLEKSWRSTVEWFSTLGMLYWGWHVTYVGQSGRLTNCMNIRASDKRMKLAYGHPTRRTSNSSASPLGTLRAYPWHHHYETILVSQWNRHLSRPLPKYRICRILLNHFV